MRTLKYGNWYANRTQDFCLGAANFNVRNFKIISKSSGLIKNFSSHEKYL